MGKNKQKPKAAKKTNPTVAKNKQKPKAAKKTKPAGQNKKTAGQRKPPTKAPKAPKVKNPQQSAAKAPKAPQVKSPQQSAAKAQKLKSQQQSAAKAPKVQNVKSPQQSAAKAAKVPKSGAIAHCNIQARSAIPGTSKNTTQAKKIAPKRKLEQPKQEIRYDNRPIHISVVNPAPANPMSFNVMPSPPSNQQQIISPGSSRGFQTPNTYPISGEVKPINLQEETRPEGHLENPKSSKDELFSLQKSLIESCNKTHVKDLLDDLRHERILSDSEVERITEEYSTTSDKMRELCNMVRKKGERASSMLLQKLCKRDPTLCSSLGIKDQLNSAEQDEIPLKKPYFVESSK